MEDWYKKKKKSVDSPSVEAQMNGFSYHTSPWRRLYRRISNLIPHADDGIHEISTFFHSVGGRSTTRMASISHRVRSSFRYSERPQFVVAFC